MPSVRSPFSPHGASAVELKEQLEAQRRGEPFLVFRDGGGVQRIVDLTPTATGLTIGRAPGTDVCLSWDEEVSGVHAELARVGPGWTVVDDGLSQNGTFVNGSRVAGRLRLREGDVLRFGRTQIAFRGGTTVVGETKPVRRDAPPAISPAQRRVLVALCRPCRRRGTVAAPSTNKQIADELCLSVEGVKTQIRALFDRFGVEDLPQNRKRSRLVELAFESGAITDRDLEP